MEIYFIISELIFLFLIIYINDLRIGLLSKAAESENKVFRNSAYVLAACIGALWYFYNQVFDVLKTKYFVEEQMIMKIASIAIFFLAIFILKFVFKRKIFNLKY